MRFTSLVVVLSLLAPASASAGVASEAIGAAIRKITGHTARKAGKETAEQLGKRAAAEAAQEATEAAAQRTASMAARHFSQTAAASPQFADDLAKAYAKLNPQNQRRLVMLAPELEQTGHAASVVGRMASPGGSADELIETLWKHRGKIATAAAVAGVVVHGDAVAAATGEYVAKPLIDGTMEHVVAPASRVIVFGVTLVGLATLAALLMIGRSRIRVAILKALLARTGLPLTARFSRRKQGKGRDDVQ
jgi:hypothetical protein